MPRTTTAPAAGPRFTLARVRLNACGYDDAGRYFGRGAPLYRYSADDGTRDGHCRAGSREAAKAYIIETGCPRATFYR